MAADILSILSHGTLSTPDGTGTTYNVSSTATCVTSGLGVGSCE